MSAASRRGAFIGVVLVLAIVGGLTWFLWQDESVPQDVEVLAGSHDGLGDAPVFGSSEPDVSEPEPVPPGLIVSVPVDMGRSIDPELALELAPVVARGNVTWPAGFGVDSVEVLLFDDDGFMVDFAITGAGGAYELRCEDPLLAGWSIGTEEQLVHWSGEETFLLPAICAELPMHLPGQPPVQCDLRMGFAPTLAGRVDSSADGRPIEGAEVFAASMLRPWVTSEVSTLTEADGSYLLPLDDLPGQGVIVWFLADDHQALMVGPMNLIPTSVPGVMVRVDATLDVEKALRGRVLDAGSDEPLPGVMVTVGSSYSALTRAGDWDVTGDDGEFALDTTMLPADGSWLLAAADGYGPAVLFPDNPASTHVIRLGPIQTVYGIVLDSISGQPIDEADVMIVFVGDTWELDHGLYDEEFSGADGRFEILLETVPVHAARVRVRCDGYVPLSAPLEQVATQASGGAWNAVLELTSL